MKINLKIAFIFAITVIVFSAESTWAGKVQIKNFDFRPHGQADCRLEFYGLGGIDRIPMPAPSGANGEGITTELPSGEYTNVILGCHKKPYGTTCTSSSKNSIIITGDDTVEASVMITKNPKNSKDIRCEYETFSSEAKAKR